MALSLLVFSGALGQSAPAPGNSASAAPGDSLTLSDAVRAAVANHPSVQQAVEAVQTAEAQVAVAQSATGPELSGAATYTRLDPVSVFALPGGISEELYPANNYDIHLEASKRLYDFGRTAATIRISEAGLASARDNVEMARWNLAYMTSSTFNLILILRRNLTVLDEQISTLDEHLRISEKRLETGSATKLDVLTTQVRVASAQSSRVDEARALAFQEIIMRSLLGYPQDRPLPLKGEFSVSPARFDLDSLLTAAGNARPELKEARDAENSATLAARLAGLGEKPTVGLGVTSGFKNGFFPNLDQWRLNLVAVLAVEVPIFDGHRTLHQEDAAQAVLRTARAHTNDLLRRVAAEVEQAVAGAKASYEKLNDAQVEVSRAEEAVSMAKTQYMAGVVTNLDLLDAETSLSEARLLLLRSQYETVQSLDALDKATGKKIW